MSYIFDFINIISLRVRGLSSESCENGKNLKIEWFFFRVLSSLPHGCGFLIIMVMASVLQGQYITTPRFMLGVRDYRPLRGGRTRPSLQSRKKRLPKLSSFQNTCPKETSKVAKFHRDTKRTPWLVTSSKVSTWERVFFVLFFYVT